MSFKIASSGISRVLNTKKRLELRGWECSIAPFDRGTLHVCVKAHAVPHKHQYAQVSVYKDARSSIGLFPSSEVSTLGLPEELPTPGSRAVLSSQKVLEGSLQHTAFLC